MKITITIRGVQNVRGKIANLQRASQDWTEELTAVGKWLQEWQNQVFETEGSVIGESWQALTPQYADWKAHNYPGRGILQLTGTLQKGWELKVGSKQLNFTNKTPWALAQNYGYPPRNLPARTFFKIEDAQKKKIHDIIAETFQRRVNNG